MYQSNSTGDVTTCTFNNNTATNGGAVYQNLGQGKLSGTTRAQSLRMHGPFTRHMPVLGSHLSTSAALYAISWSSVACSDHDRRALFAGNIIRTAFIGNFAGQKVGPVLFVLPVCLSYLKVCFLVSSTENWGAALLQVFLQKDLAVSSRVVHILLQAQAATYSTLLSRQTELHNQADLILKFRCIVLSVCTCSTLIVTTIPVGVTFISILRFISLLSLEHS